MDDKISTAEELTDHIMSIQYFGTFHILQNNLKLTFIIKNVLGNTVLRNMINQILTTKITNVNYQFFI